VKSIIHSIKTTKKEVFFYSYKGDSPEPTLDQVTLPPAMGITSFPVDGHGLFHQFGEWLKREGHEWESLSDEVICRLSIDYFNVLEHEPSKRRRFARLRLPALGNQS
jgi:hypothetical protein